MLCNVPMFDGWDADVIILIRKIAILWNGIFHYKQIMKSQSLKQARDKIKWDVIIRNGSTPYEIKDMGKYDPNFVRQEFEAFLLSRWSWVRIPSGTFFKLNKFKKYNVFVSSDLCVHGLLHGLNSLLHALLNSLLHALHGLLNSLLYALLGALHDLLDALLGALHDLLDVLLSSALFGSAFLLT